MNQQRVWDKIAERWQTFREKAPEEVVEFLEHQKGKVLDMGCGGGRNFVKNKNITYYGVDFSGEMLKFAKNKAKRAGIKAILNKSSLEKLPFESNFFDGAIFISTLQCIENTRDRLKSLKELYRVLKKNGEAMITVWDKSSDKNLAKIKRKESYVTWKVFGKRYNRYYYFYEKQELVKLLKNVGFKIINKKTNIKSRHSAKNIIVYIKK